MLLGKIKFTFHFVWVKKKGTKRVVSYEASDKTGFNAIVKKIGHAHHYPSHAYDDHHAYGHQYGYPHHY